MSASFVAILDEHEKSLKKALDAAKESPDSWAGGPRLEDYLPPGGADYLSNLLALVGQDLEMRLARGMDLSAVSYVERFPTLRSLGGELFYLVEREIHWKAYWKLPLDAEYLVESFPQLSHSILEKLRQKGILPPEIPGFDGLEKIGRGGMGVVYRATETRLNRLVALKVIRPDRVTDPDHDMQFRQRFQEEAEKMAAVSHPHVVQVFQSGQVGEQVFLAMEYVPGETLQAKINREGKLGFREAAEVVEKIALGVAAVHVTGTIHRDLKPDNVLVSDKGVPKVADFGLARQIEPTDGATQEGVFRGTAEYASPEQASMGNQDLTERTDVYGLGGILYACLTGRPPFPSHLLSEVLRRVVNEPVEAIRGLRPDCPRDLETICLKCLEKDPKRRYQSAVELAEDLRRYQEGKPILARPVGVLEKGWLWARRNKALAGALATIAVVLILATGISSSFGWWALVEKANAVEKEGLANRKTVEANQEKKIAEEQRLKAEDNLYISTIQRAQMELEHGDPAIAWEKLVSIPFEKRGWEHHYLNTQIQKNHATIKNDVNQLINKKLSPNGELLIADLNGSPVLCDILKNSILYQFKVSSVFINSNANMFSPDSSLIALSGNVFFQNDERIQYAPTIKIWNTKTGMELSNLKPDTDEVFKSGIDKDDANRIFPHDIKSLSFSHDNKYLAFSTNTGILTVWDIHQHKGLFTLKEKKNDRWNFLNDGYESITFSPSGKHLATQNSTGEIVVWDLETRRVLFTLEGRDLGSNSMNFSVDGKHLAYLDGFENSISILDISTGKKKHPFKADSRYLTSFIYSPDGGRIATQGTDNTIQVWNTVTGQSLLNLKVPERSPTIGLAFSTDGSRLFSASLNTVKIWDLATTKEPTRVKVNRDSIDKKNISLDGKIIASIRWDQTELWDAKTGRNLFTLTNYPAELCQFSPDSKKIAFGLRDGTIEVWDTTNGRLLQTFKRQPQSLKRESVKAVAISPGGKLLASGSSEGTITVWDFNTNLEILTLKGFTVGVVALTFSPDGKRLVSSCEDGAIKLWDATTWQEIFTIKDHEKYFRSKISFSPDGKQFAVAGWYGVQMFDSETGKVSHSLKHRRAVFSITFSPDGKRLATSCHDETIKIWDTSTGQELITIPNPIETWANILFSSDGVQIFSVGEDYQIAKWEAIENEELIVTDCERRIWDLTITPDGNHVITRHPDNEIKVWSIQSGKEMPLDTVHDLSVIDQKPLLSTPNGMFSIEAYDMELHIIHNQYRQERIARNKNLLYTIFKPNPQWHLDQAKESESAQLPFSTAFHLAWARRCGAWKPQVTTDLWKNLQATRPSPARDKLQAQVLGEDVGRMILAGTSASQGNWAGSLTGLR